MEAPPTRKVRPDAILRQLPEERQLTIFAALQKLSYADVKKSLAADGIEIGTTALSDFYQFWCSETFFRKAEVGRQQLLAQITASTPELTMEQATDLADAAFIATTAAVGDLPGYLGVRKIIAAERKTQLESRRVSLLEKKAKALDALEEDLKAKRGKGGLSAETLSVIENALGMMK
jgi:hypothetical protein